jgi:hypothetical protein
MTNRRLALRRNDLPAKLRKVRLSVRVSKETYIFLNFLVRKYPGLYASKSHAIECCIRRAYMLHKRNKIEVMY